VTGDGYSHGDGDHSDHGGGGGGAPLSFGVSGQPFFSIDASAAFEDAQIQILEAGRLGGNARLFEVTPLLVLGPPSNLTFIYHFIQSFLQTNSPATASPRSVPKWARPSAHPPAPAAVRLRGGGDAPSSSQADEQWLQQMELPSSNL